MKKYIIYSMTAVFALSAMFIACKKDKDDKGNNSGIPVTGVTLDPGTLTLMVDGTATLTATVLPEDATNKDVTWASDNFDVATVDNGAVTAKAAGTATITVTTVDGDKTATCAVEVYEESVVINGVRWATRNVDMPGTFAAKPEDAGMFYQWNRKVGWSSTDPMINSDGGTTWGSYTEGYTWEKANDPSPAGYRVPTQAELENLANTTYVTHEWTTKNGVNGFRCTDKATGVSLFLPAAGNRTNNNGSLCFVGRYGIYWSSTPSGSGKAYDLSLSSDNFAVYNDIRAFGFSVRCVADE